jgi:hypothetical protein
MRVTRHDLPAYWAAVAAFREALPEMSEEEAKLETTRAIAYGSDSPSAISSVRLPRHGRGSGS